MSHHVVVRQYLYPVFSYKGAFGSHRFYQTEANFRVITAMGALDPQPPVLPRLLVVIRDTCDVLTYVFYYFNTYA